MPRQNYEEGRGQCPFCREWISIEAERCPECTSILTQNEEWLEQQNHHGRRGTGFGWGTGAGNAWGWSGTGTGAGSRRRRNAGGCSTALLVVSLGGSLVVYSLVKLFG